VKKLLQSSIFDIVIEILILMCLVVMLLAGNDIWHDTGRADFWHLNKPPYADVRVFACAYYALVGLVVGRIVVRLGKLIVGHKRAVELRS